MNKSTSGFVKIIFCLTRDADGYPPIDKEGLWATPLGNNRFVLDNIPFFARGVSLGDVVEATIKDDEYHFKRVMKQSDHSTIRVLVQDQSTMQNLRDKLQELGCSSELSHLPMLFAIDVPPEPSLSKVIAFLKNAEERDLLEYEEGSCRNSASEKGTWWKLWK